MGSLAGLVNIRVVIINGILSPTSSVSLFLLIVALNAKITVELVTKDSLSPALIVVISLPRTQLLPLVVHISMTETLGMGTY